MTRMTKNLRARLTDLGAVSIGPRDVEVRIMDTDEGCEDMVDYAATEAAAEMVRNIIGATCTSITGNGTHIVYRNPNHAAPAYNR